MVIYLYCQWIKKLEWNDCSFIATRVNSFLCDDIDYLDNEGANVLDYVIPSFS